MGRYRRGHRHRKSRGQNRKQNQNGDDGAESLSSYTYSPQLGEADWILVEKYLLEYRSRAYGIHYSKEGLSRCHQHQPLNVPIHKFLPLTSEMCKRPYIDLPDTLSPKERHKVHAMCACLDLFHAGAGGDNAGTNTKDEGAAINDSAVNNGTSTSTLKRRRRIVISIYADGLKFVPDLEPSYARGGRQSFPSRICQPWYFKAKSSTTNNSTEQCQRLQTIELEKKKIRQFANLPEQSLRTSDGSDQSFCDSLDFNVLDSLDLSMVPSPEETSWVLVDTVDKLKLCADELVYGVGTSGDDKARSPKIHELAFDLEMHNIGGGSGGIRTCLIQITSDVATIVYDEHSKSSKEVYKDYVIDPLAPGVWSAILTFLGPIFSNPEIVKIGHGIGGMDTSSLHRDFGILIVNAFDTYEASTILSSGKGGMGLAMLCRHYGLPSWEHYKRLKHQYQRSDWSKRPLDNDALEYGRYDIRYLVALRKLLLRDLARLDMIGSGYLRFGSSIEDDSGVESTPASKEGTQNLHSFESRLDSTTSSSVSSFSENEFNTTATSGNSLNQFKDVEGDVGESKLMKLGNCAGDVVADSVDSQGEPSLPSSSIKSIITASEFPCYHHLMKAISISQKRCLKLWTGEDDEPILKNRALLTMIKHAANEKGHGKHWSDGNMQLYKQLTEWRVNVAQQELNSVSGVCSLDFLVHVAYKLTKNRCEMRRYSYVLPVLLEDESLPYCDELCEIVTSSDVFQRQGQRMDVMDVVFYSNDEDNCEKKQERQKQLFKLLFASTVIGVTFLAITRSRRR